MQVNVLKYAKNSGQVKISWTKNSETVNNDRYFVYYLQTSHVSCQKLCITECTEHSQGQNPSLPKTSEQCADPEHGDETVT